MFDFYSKMVYCIELGIIAMNLISFPTYFDILYDFLCIGEFVSCRPVALRKIGVHEPLSL